MSRWKKSNFIRAALILAGGFSDLAAAEIVVDTDFVHLYVLDYTVSPPRTVMVQSPKSMPSILIVPGALPLQNPSTYLAWRKLNSGVSVGTTPALGSTASMSSTQLQNQRNIARAQAYRLDYFKKP